jgi:hypothetical protein
MSMHWHTGTSKELTVLRLEEECNSNSASKPNALGSARTVDESSMLVGTMNQTYNIIYDEHQPDPAVVC